MASSWNRRSGLLLTIYIAVLLLLLAAKCSTQKLAPLRPHVADDDDADNDYSNDVSLDADDYSNEVSSELDDGDMTRNFNLDEELDDESDDDDFCEWHKCDNDLSEPRGIGKYFDFAFLKKFMRNLNPFRMKRMQMHFYLFKRAFPDCGRELGIDDDEERILQAGFDPDQPTRIIIHGWMSQSRGSFNRDVKNAYISRGDYNVIVVDWSASASNVNYFAVARMIDAFGALLARFTQHLHRTVEMSYDDVYLIGHSLGAQMAGAAGKLIRPAQFNTIFALDPAGPKFRHRSAEFRIDPTDAKYVESIQTSGNLGFLEPTGNATFYPNYGVYQGNCYYVGCSHIRAYKMFAESITSDVGFWGTRCHRRKPKWECNETAQEQYQMGGEPAVRKRGLFYVKTRTSAPFALGPAAIRD